MARKIALINPRVDEFSTHIVEKGSVHQKIERRIRFAHKREVVILAFKALAGAQHHASVGQQMLMELFDNFLLRLGRKVEKNISEKDDIELR